MKIVQSAGGIVLNKQSQIIIVSNRGKSWTFPKGHIEYNEDPLTAAKREIYEETGVNDLNLIEDLGFFDRSKKYKGKKTKRIHMYLFESTQKELEPRDPHNPEALWVDKDQVFNLLTYEEDKKFFLSIRDQL